MISPFSSLNKWHYSNLLRHYGSDSSKLFTARMLSGILLAVSLVIATFLTANIVSGEEIMDLRSKQFFVPFQFGILFTTLYSYILMIRGQYESSLSLFSVLVCTAIFTAIVVTGGFPYSVATPAVIMAPVIVFCLHGSRAGYWTALMFPVAFALQWVVVSLFKIRLPDMTSQAIPEFNVLGVIFITYAVILFVIYSYERRSVSLREELQSERNRYAELADRDDLTGLYNSRYFHHRLEHELQANQPVGLLYFDLDNFKPVNDTLGHDVGDFVLRIVARRIINCIRDGDIVARLGGDEFAVIMAGDVSPGVIEDAKSRMQHSVGQPMKYNENMLRIGASAGSAIYPEEGQSPMELLKVADQSMYRDKNSKRKNQNEMIPKLEIIHEEVA